MMKLMETVVNAFAYTVLLFFTLIFLAVALLIVWIIFHMLFLQW